MVNVLTGLILYLTLIQSQMNKDRKDRKFGHKVAVGDLSSNRASRSYPKAQRSCTAWCRHKCSSNVAVLLHPWRAQKIQFKGVKVDGFV